MRALWRYIQVKENRDILAFVCGGLAAVVTGAWAAYTHLSKKDAPGRPQAVVSAPGGVAAGSISGSTITIAPRAAPP